MKINLSNIFEMQINLDKKIQDIHHVCYKQIYDKLKLALSVELCELANEIKFFKYWSTKPASEKSIILEEYVDGIHFISSICIVKNIEPIFEIKKAYSLATKDELVKIFLELLTNVKDLNTKTKIINWYQKYLILGIKLGFNIDEIIHSYINKNKINICRQKNNY